MSYCKVIIIGNLTREPELRVTPTGTQIAQFAVAINRKWKDANGQPKDEVSFVDIEAWGKTAENIAKYFHKGDPIFVDGRLKQDSWEDKTSGQKRTRLKVIAEQFQFQGGKRNGGESDPDQTPPPPRHTSPPRQAEQQTNLDEDVPF